ncbi:hypothetical protein THRCLA_21586 [Thraustotheca clavata]|uniref:Uncharacterized protein n=1 Tax=Thraustotheca clavata TaxID=74557 RepID=A0A1V9ZVP2_9STRA|nr:hypothetical protein THRCLA_21586 [Thraustotheca clavata]
MPKKYGPTALYDALYNDEMGLSRKTKRSAWSICGWIPTSSDEPAFEEAEHITLMYCGSPQLGTINWNIVQRLLTLLQYKSSLKMLLLNTEHTIFSTVHVPSFWTMYECIMSLLFKEMFLTLL